MAQAQVNRRPKTPPPQPDPDTDLEEVPEKTPAVRTAKNGKTAAATAGVPDRFTLRDGVDFWDWLSGFSTDDWQYLIAYLWRTAPVLDRKFAGKASHVKKFTTKFDIDRIKVEEGSGGYRVDFCRTDPATGTQKRIAQYYFSVLDMDYPPRVPAGEWLNDPDNITWQWAEKKIKAREAAEIDNPGPANGNPYTPDPAAMFSTVLNGIRTLRGEQSDNATLAETVLSIASKSQDRIMELSDPGKQLVTLKGLLDSLAPKNDGNDFLLNFLREELRETRAEMRDMRARAEARPSQDIVTLFLENSDRIVAVAEKLGLGPKRGEAAVSAGTTIAQIGLEVVNKLGDHIPEIIEVIKLKAAMGGTAAPAPNGQTTKWTPRLQQDKADAAPAAAPAAQQQPPASQQPQQPATAAAPPAAAPQHAEQPADVAQEEAKMKRVWEKFGPLITNVVPFLVDHFRNDLGGYKFRDFFCDRKGTENWRLLRDESGSNTLANLAHSHPVLQTALQPREKLIVFLDEFFSSDPDPDNEAALSPEGPTIIETTAEEISHA